MLGVSPPRPELLPAMLRPPTVTLWSSSGAWTSSTPLPAFINEVYHIENLKLAWYSQRWQVLPAFLLRE
jgi:hypothetical protein